MCDDTMLCFEKTPEEIRLMAAYVAELVKQGVGFRVTNGCGEFKVWLTGGF